MARYRGLLGWLVGLSLTISCDNVPPVFPPVKDKDADEVDYCPSACERQIELGCADEQVCDSFVDGECDKWVSCTEWCEHVVVEAPNAILFHPKCVATVELPKDPVDVCDFLDLTCGDCENEEVDCDE